VVRNEESAQRWLALLIKNLNEPISDSSAGIAAVNLNSTSTSNSNGASYTTTGPTSRVSQSNAAQQQSSVNMSPISTGSAGAFGYNVNSGMPTSWNGNNSQ